MPIRKRIFTTTAIGLSTFILGVVLFLTSGVIAASSNTVNNGQGMVMTDPASRDRDEVLWCAFSFTLMLTGSGMAAIGLMAWCRSDP